MKRYIVFVLSSICLFSVVTAHADSKKVIEQVESAIAAQKDLGAYEIEIDYYAGLVTLSGQVASEQARSKVVALTAQVKGVDQVRDDLLVKSDNTNNSAVSLTR